MEGDDLKHSVITDNWSGDMTEKWNANVGMLEVKIDVTAKK